MYAFERDRRARKLGVMQSLIDRRIRGNNKIKRSISEHAVRARARDNRR